MDIVDEYEIIPARESGELRASPQQGRIWFNDQLDESGLQFIYSSGLRLRGPVDVGALQRSIELLIARHEVLRTRITSREGVPWQIIEPAYGLDLTPCPVADEASLPKAVHEFVNRPFDLDDGRALRAVLLQLSDTDHALVLAIHHVATDGFSNGILMQELAEAYKAYAAGEEAELKAVELRYRDYTEWQARWLAGTSAKSALAYWRKQLGNAKTTMDLPVDQPWPAQQSFRGQWVSHLAAEELRERAEGLAHEESASLFMVLLAAFQLTLSRWTGQKDLIVGTAAANRSVPGTEDIVGPFTNMLPLRTQVDEAASFRQLLRQVRDTTLDGYEHLLVPFDRIVEEISPDRTPTRNTVIQVTLTEEPAPDLHLGGLDVEYISSRPDSVRFDLTFYYCPLSDGRLKVEANYATDVFRRDTIDALLQRFVHTFGRLLSSPDAAMSGIDTLTPEEERQIREWSEGPATGSDVVPLHKAISARAAEHPDRLAVRAGTDSLTFAELEERAGRIAGLLRAHGVGVESPVGILMGRSVSLAPAIVGVLKAGGYYVPMDPAYPAQRLQGMIEDCGARVVLTDQDVAVDGLVYPAGVQLVPVTDADGCEEAPAAALTRDNLAYAIYTSGSTGTPKPVQVTHRGAANLLAALEEAGAAGPGHNRVGWNASPSFDASVQQWIRLGRGDTVVVVSDDERQDPVLLGELIESAELTHLDITPVHLDLMIDHVPFKATDAGPLHLLIGGERISPALWRKITALTDEGAIRGINVYGPTETTVDATAGWITGDVPHIGRPLRGVSVAVVDESGRPVPPGVPGELLIGGAGVARGYGGRPGQTAGAFRANPFRVDGSRLYHSGDRVRWLPDGCLEYLGRGDRQVKLRGFRMELNEVESVLSSIAGIGRVIAMVRELPGGPGLVAYCTGAEDVRPDREVVRKESARRLPAYMVPEMIVLMDDLPTGPGGKVDTDRLPDPVMPDSDEEDGALSGPIEVLIGEIWTTVLGLDSVRPSDSFFSLGGHSMHATRVVAAMRKRLKLAMPVTIVFQYPRLRALAQHVEGLIQERLAAMGEPGSR
ncbi:amino acid adenylation domain-containing protein [Kitasatospora sp. NPDC004669]|uniref:non-ribosomal peptide synthetase n=1 Tax=Kitasatospora sp. NPDC004669 TaxID=3154555 RepID=UPI0033BB82ED